MSAIDILILIVIAIAAISGFRKGLISQLGSVLGIIAGIIVCRLFGSEFADFLDLNLSDATTSAESSAYLNSAIANLILFVATYLAARLLSGIISNVASGLCLGIVDRIGGVVFAIFEWLLGLSLILNLFQAFFPDTHLVTSSSGIADEYIMDLAPSILGSETAQEMFSTIDELSEKD